MPKLNLVMLVFAMAGVNALHLTTTVPTAMTLVSIVLLLPMQLPKTTPLVFVTHKNAEPVITTPQVCSILAVSKLNLLEQKALRGLFYCVHN